MRTPCFAQRDTVDAHLPTIAFVDSFFWRAVVAGMPAVRETGTGSRRARFRVLFPADSRL